MDAAADAMHLNRSVPRSGTTRRAVFARWLAWAALHETMGWTQHRISVAAKKARPTVIHGLRELDAVKIDGEYGREVRSAALEVKRAVIGSKASRKAPRGILEALSSCCNSALAVVQDNDQVSTWCLRCHKPADVLVDDR